MKLEESNSILDMSHLGCPSNVWIYNLGAQKGRSHLGRVTRKGWVALGLYANLHCTGMQKKFKFIQKQPPYPHPPPHTKKKKKKPWENEKNLRQMKMIIIIIIIIITIYGSLICTKSKHI